MKVMKRTLQTLIAAGAFLLAMPHASFAACSNPVGQAGEAVFNEDHNVMQYCDDTNWIAMAGGQSYKPNAVYFDGAGDNLNHGSALSGVSDTKMITGSLWVKDFTLGSFQNVLRIGQNGGGDFALNFGVSNQVRFYASNSAGTIILDADTPNATVDGTWQHILFSFDLSDPNKRHIYVNGVDSFDAASTYTDDFLDVTGNRNHLIDGAAHNNAFADVWVDTGTYIDLSVEANRRKFIDASGNPVYLGASGELPTGTSPDIFFSGDTASWHTNKGTGGGFTENGALTDAIGPMDITSVVPNGLVGHWRLDETGGATVADSSGNGLDGTVANGLDISTSNVTGVVGGGINFAGGGTLEAIDLGNPNELRITGAITVAGWFRQNVNEGPYYITKMASANRPYDLSANSGVDGPVVEFRVAAPGACSTGISSGTSTQELELGEWAYLVGVYEPSSYLRVYINGELASENTSGIPASICDNTDAVYVGCREDGLCGNGFNGDADDIRIYNRALTESEINALYQARDGVRYNEAYRTPQFFDGNRWVSVAPAWPEVTDGLIGHWKLDETTGTTAADSSGNGNNGTMTGSMDAANDSAPGPVAMSLAFDGIDDYISAGSGASLDNVFVGGGTVAAWIRVPANPSNYGRIVSKELDRNINDGWNINFDHVANEITFGQGFTTRGRWNSGATINPNEWVHVVVTYDNSSAANDPVFYFDGSIVPGTTEVQTPSGSVDDDSAQEVRIGNTGAGTNDRFFRGDIDDVRLYNRVLTAAEIQTLYSMGAPVGQSTALPQGCSSAGDVCDDGTVYAGLSPDGDIEMYVAKTDISSDLSWNAGNAATGSMVSVPDATCYLGGEAGCQTGEQNTGNAVVLDSDSSTGGFQLHNAAQACWDLVLAGADDWYLPAQEELEILYNNRTVGGFAGTFDATQYWSSSEPNASAIYFYDFGGSGVNSSTKELSYAVRCVRKGPAPRCANPYGLEGQMVYNADNNVMQYCDGARWLAIGKDN